MKKILSLMLIFFISVSLCSCYDQREIDATAYVIALGIDKGEKVNSYTFQISSPLAMGGGGEISDMGEGEENNRVENIIIGAKDLYEAREVLNNFLSKKVNLSHLKLIAVSEEMAKAGLETHMNFILQEREVRPNTRMCITIGSAQEFLKGINPALEANTAEYYDLVFENGAVFSMSKKLWEFVNEAETFGTVLPTGRISKYKESSEFKGAETASRVSDSKSEFSGLYMVKGYKAMGELSPEKSRIYSLLTGKLSRAEISIAKDGAMATVNLISQGKGKVTVKKGEDALTAVLSADFIAEIKNQGSGIKKRDIEEYLSKEAYAIFLKGKEADCDIFKAGDYMKMRCKTITEWESINWDDEFKKIYFLPQINVKIQSSERGTV